VTVPKGSLPVFSVETEEQAERLLTIACPTNLRGEYIAEELAEHQTLDNLAAFSDRLAETFGRHQDFIVGNTKGGRP
jgi:hypothetical protein